MDSIPAHRASWKVRLIALGIGIVVAAATFGIVLLVSEDLRLLYLCGALLLAITAFFGKCQSAGRLDRRCSASFGLDVLVRVLRPAANTVSLADAPAVVGDCHVPAVQETIRQNNQNRWDSNINRGLSLVLCLLHSGADAASANASASPFNREGKRSSPAGAAEIQ
jgi:hypothetical protein